jgi:3-hydroxybutyryl-CoA dehydrogenase
MARSLETIVAAGSGRMGRSMAIAFAYAGVSVTVLDLKERDAAGDQEQRDAALAEIDDHLQTLHRVELIARDTIDTIKNRIRFASRGEHIDVLANADLVLEGVPERRNDKADAFELLERCVSADCVLASTTSTFLAPDLAAQLQRPERFLNAHWLNPAYIIPLVEVSPHEKTDPDVTDAVVDLLTQIGKQPVLCSPSPGYIVPRLQALVMNEAARMVQEGVASAEDIDRAVRLGFGLRYASMGVLEFVDFGGLDILFYANRYMAEHVDDKRYETPEIVEQLMQQGKVGLRSGQGLYDWSKIDVPQYRDQVIRRLSHSLQREGLLRPPVSD